MTPDLIAGIDPGQSGGIAILTFTGEIVAVWPMPETEHEVIQGLAEFQARLAVVALEKVGPMPKQGVASVFKFGRSYGFLRGALTAMLIRVEDVRPQEWQKALGCMSGGKKAVTRQKAQQLWPKCYRRITDKIADALLIAEWARRQERREIKIQEGFDSQRLLTDAIS